MPSETIKPRLVERFDDCALRHFRKFDKGDSNLKRFLL